jgi:glutathione S-transferase
VLVEEDGTALGDALAIAEYLEEVQSHAGLSRDDADGAGRGAPPRRLVRRQIHREVTANLFDQKILRRLKGNGGPDSQALRSGNSNIHYHLDYVGWLVDRRRWLAGDEFSPPT